MTWLRALLGLTAVAAAVAVVLAVRAAGVTEVREVVAGAGVSAPLLFVLFSGAVTLTPVPRTVFTVAAGVLFGPVTGVLLAVVGTMLAAAVAFGLVRLVGGPLVERPSTSHWSGSGPGSTAAGCSRWRRCG